MPSFSRANRIHRAIPILVLAALATGCASSGASKSYSSQWQQAGTNSYTNTNTGQQISKEQYGTLVAREVYAQLSARPGSGRFCK